jgi:hypothetical protein
MDFAFRRSWDGIAWQRYALTLVQARHGGSNVQRVPDKVNGDAGVEFFTLNGCLYQCYAPEDPGNTSKCSSAMKQKATRDLPKLKKNESFLCRLLSGLTFDRWILFCPFLDDKTVIAHVREKGMEIRAMGLPFLAANFGAIVQSQEDFTAEIVRLRNLPIGPDLQVPSPTDDAIAARDSTPLTKTLDEKLNRAFPLETDAQRAKIRRTYVKHHIKRENTLDSLKTDHPALWERAWQTINAEESRLEMLGAAGASAPAQHLRESLMRIEEGLSKDLPHVAHATITDISAGTLSDWLMRCPLDFTVGE